MRLLIIDLSKYVRYRPIFFSFFSRAYSSLVERQIWFSFLKPSVILFNFFVEVAYCIDELFSQSLYSFYRLFRDRAGWFTFPWCNLPTWFDFDLVYLKCNISMILPFLFWHSAFATVSLKAANDNSLFLKEHLGWLVELDDLAKIVFVGYLRLSNFHALVSNHFHPTHRPKSFSILPPFPSAEDVLNTHTVLISGNVYDGRMCDGTS